MVSLYELQQMDSDDFEHLVAEIWSAMGYDTQVTQGGADRGIDVIATNDSEKVLIQAKRYSSGNKVGAPKIREYSALYQQEGATDVVVVTTGEFTSNASELAPTIGVTTVNGEELTEMIGDDSSDQQSDVARHADSISGYDSILNASFFVLIELMKGGVVILREGLLKLGFYVANVLMIAMAIIMFIISLITGDLDGVGWSLFIIPISLIGTSMIYFPIKFVLSLTEGMIYPEQYPEKSEESDDGSSSTS